MEWTDELKKEMQEKYQRHIGNTFKMVIFTIPVWIGLIYYLYKFEVGIHSDLLVMGWLIYVFSCLPIFHFLLKKTAWMQVTAWIILFWDTSNVTYFSYMQGIPLSYSMLFYPMAVVGYSIYINPYMANRLYVVCMLVLAPLTYLTFIGKIPFAPMFQSNVGIFSPLAKLGIESGNAKFVIFFAYLYVALCSFITLLATNIIVKERAEREAELSRSHAQISSLSEKLKVYLPHQFVDSLASGDRDINPDYRRKRLTIFFSDVKGFTSWTDSLEPEEVREILDRYLSEMGRIIHKWGGTIDKFIGDAIMVFFGDPEFTNDKDHALRCTKMAMEMQEKMAELRNEWEGMGYEKPLHIRIGINTGFATVGNFGSKERLDYTALGSAVNLASRLETASRPDKITISHTTYSFIKEEIDCTPMGEITVKGFSEPVKIYEVVGNKAAST